MELGRAYSTIQDHHMVQVHGHTLSIPNDKKKQQIQTSLSVSFPFRLMQKTNESKITAMLFFPFSKAASFIVSRETYVHTKSLSPPRRPRYSTPLILFLLGTDMLQLVGRVQKVVCVSLGGKVPRVGLLNKVLVSLLLCEGYGVLLGFEVDVRALHSVARRCPAHQVVLPPVPLAEDVPVHAPDLAPVGAGLGCCFGGLVDAL